MRRPLQYVLTGIAAALLGCSLPAEGTPDVGVTDDMGAAPTGPLISDEAWEPATAEEDPFDDRPDTVTCEKGIGWGLEELDGETTVEVATGSCDYLAATQPLLSAVAPGESLTVHFVHFELTGAGEAHPAIAIDGEVLWEKRIPVPTSTFQVYIEEFIVPDGAATGAPVVFHLHNHGMNTYNLVDLRRSGE